MREKKSSIKHQIEEITEAIVHDLADNTGIAGAVDPQPILNAVVDFHMNLGTESKLVGDARHAGEYRAGFFDKILGSKNKGKRS